MSSQTAACATCGRVNRVPAQGEGIPRCGNCHAALPWITEAGDDDFAEVAQRASLPVLVDLWAAWCGPCWQVSPVLDRVAAEMAGRLKLVKVDIDANPALARRLDVQAVPTLLLLDEGKVIARRSGAAPAPVLRSWVKESTAHRAPSP